MYSNHNPVIGRLVFCFVLFTLVTGCQQAIVPSVNPSEQISNTTQITDKISIPIGKVSPDVLGDLKTTRVGTPLITTATGSNLLENPSFETGTNAWVACNNTSILAPSNDSVSGLALALSTGCMYQDVVIQPNKLYTLTCKAKLSNPTGWSGMGFGLMNSTFTTLAQGPESQITGSTWTEYSSSFTSPANSAFAAVWFYTDGAVLIDDCSFSTKTASQPDPDPATLLPNGSFDTQSNWSSCGNPATYTIASGNLNMNGVSCVFQTIDAKIGSDYRLSCSSKANTGIYSAISLTMLNSAWVAIATDTKTVTTNTFQTIDLAKTAPAGTKYVAVGFYSEGITTHESCFLTINTVAHPVPLPDGSLFPYPNGFPTDNEPALVANNLLLNPSFALQTGWTNCAPASATIATGKLNITPGVCFFQQINAEVGKTYSLSCKGSMDLPLFSVFTLNMLDVNYQSLATEVQSINTGARQWRITLAAPVNTKYITVGFYTEIATSYDYCYLTDVAPPAIIQEQIYAPVKPLEIIVPIYIDPAQDPAPWNQVISTAQSVPTTVVVNPVIGGIEGCQESTFQAMLSTLQTNNIDTIGYIPTGYTATAPSIVKERIDKFKECEGLDGVFFDEIKVSNLAEANYYQDICDYANKAFGNGKLVVNAGTNIQIPITNQFCNIALIYEFYQANWKDFAVFGYQGANTDAATSIMIHTSNTLNTTKNAIDLAYARKIDYVFITNNTIPNPWLNLGADWTGMINYIAQKNTPFN